MRTDILLLGDQSETTRIVYNHLATQLGTFRAILEEKPSSTMLLRNRIRRIGFLRVASQVMFILLLRPFLKIEARPRTAQLRQELPAPEISHECCLLVENINGEETLKHLANQKPRVVVVNGTRILNSQTLAACPAIFINTHVGITPRYRGSHGGYWALYENNPTACGVTVHLVDKGVDTGRVIAQALIYPELADNFQTYPLLQIKAALPLLHRAVVEALNGTITSSVPDGLSKLWYGPGLFEYLRGRIRSIK